MEIKEAIAKIEQQKLEFLENNVDYAGITEAYNMAIATLEKQVGWSPFDRHFLACQYCGSGEYLFNTDENLNQYCGHCGQRIDWSKSQEVKK